VINSLNVQTDGGTPLAKLDIADTALIINYGGGISPLANVRSLSVKFQLPGGKSADILANSIEGFVARTPEELLEFLRAQLRPQALWPGDGEFAESHARIHPC